MGILKTKILVSAFALGLAGALSVGLVGAAWAEDGAMVVPPLAMSTPVPEGATTEKAVLAGGCFWGVQAVFQHLKGVTNAVSGYAGGKAETAHYEVVGSGETGHAESVEVTFDPRVVSYATILQVYFSVAHNPTELNRQGPDSGTQYRSAVFATNETQAKIAQAYIEQLNKAGIFKRPVATTVNKLEGFYPAEDYHQDYATLHPRQPYIFINDLPKVENLSKLFPTLYSDKPRLVSQAASG